MPVVAVANPKGGVGKSTLSTQIAGYFASQGHSVALGDVDRQQSAHLWLQQRDAGERPIGFWEVNPDWISRPPRGVTHAVLDTPAGLQGWRLKDVLRQADGIVVPMQPSLLDMVATGQFLDDLAELRRTSKVALGIVGMRIDPRTIAAERFMNFVGSLDIPLLGCLRNTQNYVQLTGRGQSIFDIPGKRVERDVQQWQGICAWLDGLGK